MGQWLHYVFPRECPYPHAAGNMTRGRPGDMKQMMVRSQVSDDDALAFINSEAGKRAPCPKAGWAMWSMHEEHIGSMHRGRSVGRIVAQTLLTLSMVAVLVHECWRIFTRHGLRGKITKASNSIDGLSVYV